MLAEYLGVLIILALATMLTGGLLVIAWTAGPRRVFDEKQEPFECGERPVTSPRQRIAVKFYLVAILFVVFSVEAIYFYPWGATFREVGLPGLVAIALFAVPLVVGLAYEFSLAKKAVAFFKKSRSIRTVRSSLRNRDSSARSSLVRGPSGSRCSSTTICFTQRLSELCGRSNSAAI